ncbi:hypothetical protein BS17DRAFT_771528, partial [Gyrodon lividus]
MASSGPPYYIIVAHSSLQHISSCQSSSTLAHADIEYRYNDDSPLLLLPRHPDEHVLVLNHDPANPTRPTVKSASSQLALSGMKVLPAPGASADEDANRNDHMYVLEVASTSDDQCARIFIKLGCMLKNVITLAPVWSHPRSICITLR